MAMMLENLLEKYPLLGKKYVIPVVLGLLGLIFFVYGLIALLGSSKEEDISFQPASSQQIDEKSHAGVVVDIEGAVVKPGIYTLKKDARIQDVLIVAGGLSNSADRAWVSKNVNLATKLIDGGKVYIPSMQEKVAKSSDEGSGSSISSLVNINNASEAELDGLPGIGSVTASKIISNRPYQTLEELVSKKIVSKKVFDGIKEKITY